MKTELFAVPSVLPFATDPTFQIDLASVNKIIVTFYEYQLSSLDPYARKMRQVGNGDQMYNDSVNHITSDTDVSLKIPNLINGQVRDFILTVIANADININILKADGSAAFKEYKYDENGEDPFVGPFTTGWHQFYFTEAAPDVFRVEHTKLISPA